MSMKVERSTVDQVKQRFELNKKKLEEKKKAYDFEERMKELKEEEEKSKAYKKEKRKESKKKQTEGEDLYLEDKESIESIMGFSGFGTSSKN
jgi:U4/U6.U5 tri-snRNP component SNU23